jgi:hypothetical protein
MNDEGTNLDVKNGSKILEMLHQNFISFNMKKAGKKLRFRGYLLNKNRGSVFCLQDSVLAMKIANQLRKGCPRDVFSDLIEEKHIQR